MLAHGVVPSKVVILSALAVQVGVVMYVGVIGGGGQGVVLSQHGLTFPEERRISRWLAP